MRTPLATGLKLGSYTPFKNSPVRTRSALSRSVRTRCWSRSLWITLVLVLPKIPQKVKGHRISCAQPKLPTAITSLYVGVFSYHNNCSFIWLSSWMGHHKSSAAFILLLIVYECNFYCLLCKIGWVYEKGIRRLYRIQQRGVWHDWHQYCERVQSKHEPLVVMILYWLFVFRDSV